MQKLMDFNEWNINNPTATPMTALLQGHVPNLMVIKYMAFKLHKTEVFMKFRFLVENPEWNQP